MESHTKNTTNTKIYPASGPSWGGKTPTAASSLLCVFSSLYMRSLQGLLKLCISKPALGCTKYASNHC